MRLKVKQMKLILEDEQGNNIEVVSFLLNNIKLVIANNETGDLELSLNSTIVTTEIKDEQTT